MYTLMWRGGKSIAADEREADERGRREGGETIWLWSGFKKAVSERTRESRDWEITRK
jgi:hypothetical protein